MCVCVYVPRTQLISSRGRNATDGELVAKAKQHFVIGTASQDMRAAASDVFPPTSL